MTIEKHPFSIQRLDRFFQGVSYNEQSIDFVHRALPGEEGEAFLTKKKKGVCFSNPESFTKFSPHRIEPECSHYKECGGCHAQHTTYEQEIQSKEDQLKFNFKNFTLPAIKKIHSSERYYYRNRLQLHYDLKRKRLGFIHPSNKNIVEVQECLLPEPLLRRELARLYYNKKWLELVPHGAPVNGHIEIYLHKEEIFINWNSPYAYQGFQQVNNKVNDLLQENLRDLYAQLPTPKFTLDLFGGNGNLSHSFPDYQKLVVDNFVESNVLPFCRLDLFQEKGINKLFKRKDVDPDLIIVNPPRSGFKELPQIVEKYTPNHLLYMSCDIATLRRDISELAKKFEFSAEELWLIDFFPATYHFETLVLLEFKNKT